MYIFPTIQTLLYAKRKVSPYALPRDFLRGEVSSVLGCTTPVVAIRLGRLVVLLFSCTFCTAPPKIHGLSQSLEYLPFSLTNLTKAAVGYFKSCNLVLNASD